MGGLGRSRSPGPRAQLSGPSRPGCIPPPSAPPFSAAFPPSAVFLHQPWDTPALCTCSSFCLAAPPPSFPFFFWASDRCTHSFRPQVHPFIHATCAHVQQCSTLPCNTQRLLSFSPPTFHGTCAPSKAGLQWPQAGPGPQTFSFTSLRGTHELITNGADQPHSSPNLVNLGYSGVSRGHSHC